MKPLKRSRVFPREHMSHRKHSLPEIPEKTLSRTLPDGHVEIRLTLLFAAKDGKTIYSQPNKTGIYCSSDHDLLIVKFRLTLKKVVKPLYSSGRT